MKIDGAAVLVTGGCGGFGRPMVERLVSLGGHVGVLDWDAGALEGLTDELPGVRALPCDLTDPPAVEKRVAEFFEQENRIDALVNNAGILHNEPLVKLGPTGVQRHALDSWRRVLELNLNAVFHLTGLVVEKMILRRTRGVVVNISSIAARGNAGQSAYSASKAALEALTRTWAAELGRLGIRVTCVAPGYSDTGSTRAVMNPERLDSIVSAVPLRRLGRPEEIVDAVIFCLDNEFFDGKVLPVDGGLVL